MKNFLIIFSVFASFVSQATILGLNEWSVSFTNPAVVITNATLSEPDKFLVSTNGLGWGNGETNEYRDFWIQSTPIAIGTSWRPARGINAIVEIDADPANTASLFVRYSPDKKHWSTWQVLNHESASVEVSQASSGAYDEMFDKYRKMDVPWREDEEAAVKWILQQQPTFFETNQPFIGYLQFRMEGSMPGNEKLKRIRVQSAWAVSGLSSIPKDPNADKNRGGAWRFESP